MQRIAQRDTKNDTSGSLYRASVLLREVAAAGEEGCAVAELVARSGMARPTVYRVCAMLQELGWLERNPESRRFTLGSDLAILGLAAQQRHPLESIARPVLEDLSQNIEQTIYFLGRRGNEAVCLARVDGRGPVRTLLLEVGMRWPLGRGAAGMAILAGLPDDQIETVIAKNLPFLKTETEAQLRARVKKTRAVGHAYHRGLILPGMVGIGAAVHDPAGNPVASVSCSYVADWMDDTAQARCTQAILDTAATISARLATA
ncbi:IclR family transcriptional regulator [Aquicoccus sp. G2-2]|uniref:IclR family transcriptional regulator n=1 Tax=Aquicoccus sp. G2-2 TaxID=3092120 RepID=UPI002ADF990F|nr:IclR family transcriptional regulator [Aquicoccus sp. G2-2]MEA1114820.1 IclR family transcriptional regulator [Aquicoccus sp. G2-2]